MLNLPIETIGNNILKTCAQLELSDLLLESNLAGKELGSVGFLSLAMFMPNLKATSSE